MIQSIELKNFRKFQSLSLNFKNKIVIFVGPNATGKTSILEAIYLISTSKSHRTTTYETLILQHESKTNIVVQEKKKFELKLSKEGRQVYN